MRNNPSVITFGTFRLQPDQRLLTRDGKPVALRTRAMDILLYLAARAGSVIPKDELMREIWPNRVVDENNLTTQITNLRQVLGYRPDGLAFVQTVAGRGYVLRGNPEPAQPPPAETMASHLIGRAAAAAELHERLKSQRLVTIVGPAGTGKTALAREVAAEAASGFPAGTAFADLSGIQDDRRAQEAVAAVLAPSANARANERRMLLVLDGCEAGVAALAGDLLAARPHLSILATSRQVHLPGHPSVYVLAPLPVPPAPHSVQLFNERAAAIGESVTDATIVATICRQLGGNPLAIEMVAARLKTMSLSRLQSTLAERLQRLPAASHETAPVDRLLHAVMDWSYNLLAPREQVLLHMLATVPGTLAFAAIQAMSGIADHEEWVLLEQLSGLVEKALLVAEPAPERRFRLPPAVRDYIAGRQAETGDHDPPRRLKNARPGNPHVA